MIQEITAQGNKKGAFLGTVNYSYDTIGRRTNMTANGQTPVTYQYDPASRLTQVAQGTQNVGLGYDSAGRRTSLSYPNGVEASYLYDQASRLLQIEHLNSLTQVLIERLNYTYDAAGNRISFTRANSTATLLPDAVQAAYDAANEQIQFDSATPNLTYDANGNLTFDGTTTYTWDARNRLTFISGPGVSTNFEYDALGRRISKTINGVTTEYQYDGNDIVAEISGGAVGVTYLRSLNIDEPFIRQASNNEYYHVDMLGTVLVLSNGAGVAQTTYSYDPFGKTTTTGSSTNSFQFTGRENDGAGLYYYRARYYSPELERFISEDPISIQWAILVQQTFRTLPEQDVVTSADILAFIYDNGELPEPSGPGPEEVMTPWTVDPQAYAYVINSPANYSDPTGEIPPQLIGCAIGSGVSIGADLLAGNKVNWWHAGIGCVTGAIGGWPLGKTFKFATHGPHHSFRWIGKYPHWQLNWWRKGIKGSGDVFRVPFPKSWWKRGP